MNLLSKWTEKIRNVTAKYSEHRFAHVLTLMFFAAMINIFIFVIQITELRDTLQKLFTRPLVFFLNYIPILLLLLLLYGITSSVGLSVKIGYVLIGLLAIVNRTKLIYRNEPLTAFDFFLGVEAFTMSVRSNYYPEKQIVLLFLLGLILLFVFFFFYTESKQSLKKRGALITFTIIVGFLLFKTVYYSDEVSAKMPVDGSVFNEKDNYNSKGILYSLIHGSNFIAVRVPEKYTEAEFKKEEKTIHTGDKKLPNVVMIMGEAFHDISELPIFEFPIDPIANFKEIRKEAIAYGRLVTPTFAGGTADTEFEVISGMMTDRVAPNRSFSYNAVNFEVESVPHAFLEAGYRTRGFHPGEPWFYKRASVYPRLGLEEALFLSSVENPRIKGGYLSEEHTYDEFIRRLDHDVKTKEEPIFDFMVTIQNHGPYFKAKFAETFEYTSKKELSQELSESLRSYFEGVYDMDVNLKRIYEYMKSGDEPFILVYWGDHLPGLVDSVRYYEELNFDMSTETYEGEKRFYSTPYMIWANDKAKPYLKMSEQGEKTISSNYLGAYMMEFIGIDRNDPYFTFVNQLRRELPVLSRHYVFDGTEAVKKEDYQGKHLADLQKYYRWQYYRITEPYSKK